MENLFHVLRKTNSLPPSPPPPPPRSETIFRGIVEKSVNVFAFPYEEIAKPNVGYSVKQKSVSVFHAFSEKKRPHKCALKVPCLYAVNKVFVWIPLIQGYIWALYPTQNEHQFYFFHRQPTWKKKLW